MRNRLLEHLRSPQAQGIGGEEGAALLDQLADPDSKLSREWNQEHDKHVLARLLELVRLEFSSRDWEIFSKVVLEGLKRPDVAKAANIKVGNVRVICSRALSRLRKLSRGLVD